MTSASVAATTRVLAGGVSLGLGQVLNHVAHLAEEFVLVPVLSINR